MKKNILIANAVLIIAIFSLSMTKKTSQDDWPVPSKYTKMENPYADTKDSEQIGKRLYAVHCKSCHGTKGLGDGPKSNELKTKIPNFTSGDFKAQADGDLYYKSFVGRDEMPSFEKKINEEEDKWLLINYVKSL